MALRTVFSALIADYGTVFTTAALTHYRTLFAQIASIAKTFFVARALVATPAFYADIIVTFATTLAAFGA